MNPQILHWKAKSQPWVSREVPGSVFIDDHYSWGVPDGSMVKNLPITQEMQETQLQSLCWEDPLEEEMATPSKILAWRIP